MSKVKITLDAGHGKTGNPYPPQKGYYEGTQMWRLATLLKEELEKYGAIVEVTRPNINDDPSLQQRGQLAGKNGSSLFLSLHSNAPKLETDTKPTGSIVYYSITNPSNKELADKLGNKVSELMGHYYRGSKTRTYESNSSIDYYGVIRASAQSGCKCAMILEHGFHTNPKDSAFLINTENLKKLAIAEAKIIAEHFGLSKVEPKPKPKDYKEAIESIQYLSSKGRISSPQEWIDNLPKMNNLEYVFLKWANDVKKLEGDSN